MAIVVLFVAFNAQALIISAGNSLDFDGWDDHVSVPDATSLDITSAITVEVWANSSGDTWKYKKPIVLSPATPEMDLQVRIDLNITDFDYSHAQDDGDDLRFFDAGGNLLDYWIENWNTSGTSTVWVKVPISGILAIYITTVTHLLLQHRMERTSLSSLTISKERAWM